MDTSPLLVGLFPLVPARGQGLNLEPLNSRGSHVGPSLAQPRLHHVKALQTCSTLAQVDWKLLAKDKLSLLSGEGI